MIDREPTSRVTITLSPKNLEQIRELQASLGSLNMSEVVRGCIQERFEKVCLNYSRSLTTAKRVVSTQTEEEPVELTPEEVAEQDKTRKQKVAEGKKQRADRKEANLMESCVRMCTDDLQGIVGEDQSGKPVLCRFYQYVGRKRYPQEVDIKSVSSDLVNTLYSPNEKRIRELQKNGSIDYDMNTGLEDEVEEER